MTSPAEAQLVASLGWLTIMSPHTLSNSNRESRVLTRQTENAILTEYHRLRQWIPCIWEATLLSCKYFYLRLRNISKTNSRDHLDGSTTGSAVLFLRKQLSDITLIKHAIYTPNSQVIQELTSKGDIESCVSTYAVFLATPD